jgi:hypothetical protein
LVPSVLDRISTEQKFLFQALFKKCLFLFLMPKCIPARVIDKQNPGETGGLPRIFDKSDPRDKMRFGKKKIDVMHLPD